jgi:hypothetical protein
MTQKKDREALIRELENLGELIEPDPDDTPMLNALVKDPIPANSQDSLTQETPPIAKNINPEHPQTVDMFTASNRKVPKASSASAEALDSTIVPSHPTDTGHENLTVRSNREPAVTDETKVAADDKGLEELTSELLAAIEKRLSLHSGESLPESLRDELAHDISQHLAPWLHDY